MYRLTEESTEFLVCGYKHIILPKRVSVVAFYDDTSVQIYKSPGPSRQLLYDEHLDSLVTLTYKANTDMTGVYVISDKPVNVFFGAECEIVHSPGWCDGLFLQQPPLHYFGQDFILPVIKGRTIDKGYIVRILVAHDNTHISIGGTSPQDLGVSDMGHWKDVILSSGESITTVTCSKKCFCVQINIGLANTLGTDNSDTFMMIIPDVTHYVSHATFIVYNAAGTTHSHYISVVTNTNDVLMNKQLYANPVQWTSIPGMDAYKMATLKVTEGYYELEGKSLCIWVYGHVYETSYGFTPGYGAGMSSMLHFVPHF